MSGPLTSDALRAYGFATLFHLKDLTRERAELVLNIATPLFYASIAYFIFVAGGRKENAANLMLGAGLMGMWSVILFGAGTAIKNQRMLGTLEVLLGAPKRFSSAIAPLTTAVSCFGASAIVCTCAWGVLVFDVPLAAHTIPDLLLGAAVVAVSMGAFGLVVAALFVHVRRAESLASPLLAPLWMISGVLVPVTALPHVLEPVAYLLPIAWGADALRAAAAGDPYLASLLGCLATGIGYALLGTWTVNRVARSSRVKGEANLW
jgi:ABC-2 type transport system permease protein